VVEPKDDPTMGRVAPATTGHAATRPSSSPALDLAHWRQGDCVVLQQDFVFRFAPHQPVSAAAIELAADDPTADLIATPVAGFVVTTQTCDIVRSVQERPYIQVAALQAVNAQDLADVCAMRRPQYAYVPGLASRHLVADLDRIMTLEKPLLAGWERVPGCSADAERQLFAEALARKVKRFAFPDDFTQLVKKLRARLQDKHDRSTSEGQALQGLREIRVQASPDWSASEVRLKFFFIRRPGQAPLSGDTWNSLRLKWLDLVPAAGRFAKIEGDVVELEDITASEFVHSYPLDLDALSSATGPTTP
jgi:hypothetical protein